MAVSALVLLTVVAPTTAAVQRATGAIIGRLIDQASRLPVTGARLALLSTPRSCTSDTRGRCRVDSLASGTYRIEVRAVGYAVGSRVVELRDAEVRTENFALEPLAVPLDPVTVERPPSFSEQRYLDFERRRASGRGHFITEDEIAGVHPRTLGDLFRNVPGVRMQCRGVNCVLRMARAPRACAPEFIVDGFSATNATSLDIPTIGIIGIEIYRTLSETPMEFLRADNQCGTIVIWTRSGPG